MSKKFHIRGLLTVYTGISFEAHGIDAVYELLNHMTGESLYTLALISAAEEAKPYLREQHPWLVEANEYVQSRQSGGKWNETLQHCIEKYGEFHEVRPMHSEDHTHISEEDAARKAGFKGEFLTLKPPEDDGPSDIGDINWK